MCFVHSYAVDVVFTLSYKWIYHDILKLQASINLVDSVLKSMYNRLIKYLDDFEIVYTTGQNLENSAYMAHSRILSVVFMKTNNFLDNIYVYLRISVCEEICTYIL